MKRKKRKKQKAVQKNRKKHKARTLKGTHSNRIVAQKKTPTVKSPTEFYWDNIVDQCEDYRIVEPDHPSLDRRKIEALCNKPLSTGSIALLERLYSKTEDVVLRSMLAKKSYMMRRDYLQSYKEYSDRALILLAERKKYLDKWEGIYILGCFGSGSALKYLRGLLETEEERLLINTIKRAMQKIETNAEARNKERGFLRE
ncbi:MAG: hypothetical protein ACE5HO_16550 [bacterium]